MSTPEQHPWIADATTADIQYAIASTRHERAASFRLVYGSYVEAGLAQPNPWGMRVTPYQLLPTTEIFVAWLRGEPIFTMSLVVDGELGLPMEAIYGEEVGRLRRQGLLLAEVSCLADRRRAGRGFFPVFLRLSRLVAQYAWHRRVDQVLVACHPKHARFYERLLRFERLGKQKAYPMVRNRPAVALSLDLTQLAWQHPESHRILFHDMLPAWQLQPQPIPPSDRGFFGVMVDVSHSCVPVGSDQEDSSERELCAASGG
jgi:hypothetical protein